MGTLERRMTPSSGSTPCCSVRPIFVPRVKSSNPLAHAIDAELGGSLVEVIVVDPQLHPVEDAHAEQRFRQRVRLDAPVGLLSNV